MDDDTSGADVFVQLMAKFDCAAPCAIDVREKQIEEKKLQIICINWTESVCGN